MIKQSMPVYMLFFLLSVVALSPACLVADERDRAIQADTSSGRIETAQLEAWHRTPALLEVFETPDSGLLVVVGESDEVREGGVYTGPLMTLVFNAHREPIAFELSAARSSSYAVFSDARYFAINSMVPDSILPTITVYDSGAKSLRTYNTTTVFLSDFIVWDGHLYHSTEKASPTLGRFDLLTGEHYLYDGFHAQGPSFVVHEGGLYAVAQSGTYEVALEALTPKEVDLSSVDKATQTFGRGTGDAELFDSWEELLAGISTW